MKEKISDKLKESIKDEFNKCVYNYKFQDQLSAQSLIFRYIEGWYNSKRIHSALDGKSPLEAFYEKVHILAA